MIAWSSKLRPAFLERETRSELFGPRTWLSAVRWTSQTPPRQRVRSEFSLCLQTPVRQSRLTRSPATTMRLCRSHSLCCARAATAPSTSSAPVVTAGPRMCLVNGIQIPVPLYHDRLPGRCKLEFERVSASGRVWDGGVPSLRPSSPPSCSIVQGAEQTRGFEDVDRCEPTC